jgi:hypothetical protein
MELIDGAKSVKEWLTISAILAEPASNADKGTYIITRDGIII